MTIPKVLLFSLVYLSANGFPMEPLVPMTRNTIFGDEKLEGGIFEHIDNNVFNDLIAFNDERPYRLPTTTRPIHYNLHWGIDMQNLTFEGTVEINITATQAGLNQILLHSDDLEILALNVTRNNVDISDGFQLIPEYHFLVINTSETLEFNAANPVVYTITITFEAPMRDDMFGIYGSWFRNNYTDTESWIATTQFAATAARSAFPCYDEPSFKATFDITVTRPVTHKSWSNMRNRETRNLTNANYQEDVYHTTPIMSTYLLALIVAEYDSIELFTDGRLMYEVIARPSAIENGQGNYSFNVGQELLAVMNEYTGIDFYSMNNELKMTQAAVPDFDFGAMENWGLLTYREAYLMYHPDHTNSYFKQLIAYILTHEIAHMWFGNLVTCDWWDVVWLNEGFARYYQYFLTHQVEDDMGFETRFITEQVHTSLLSDSANNPQPLTNPGVANPDQVLAMFSTISYNKGAAIIRQTEHLLGSEVNRQGLQNYLVSKSFATALPTDLFQALEAAGNAAGVLTAYGSSFNFIDYYRSWTEQPGHPVLNVHVNHQTGGMTIYQRRFNINTGYSAINTNYMVPITFATGSDPDFENTKPSHIISNSLTIINRGSIGDQWTIFNKQQIGFYRVNYDEYTWSLNILALRGSNRTLIHEHNRAQIVNDVFQFARSGLMSYYRAFNILSFLEFEHDYAPWVAALTGFNWIRNRLAGTEILEEVEIMIAGWATNIMTNLTFYPIEGESFMRSYLRYQLAPVICQMDVRNNPLAQECRNAAVDQFVSSRAGLEVPVDSRQWVYCNALRQGTEDDFNFLWQRFLQHHVYTEKIVLLMILGCTPHRKSLHTFLDAIIEENFVIRPQDYTQAYNSAVTGNEGNTQIVFEYIQSNLTAVTAAFGSAVTPLSYIYTRLRSEAEIIAFQSWATSNQEALGDAYNTVFNGAESSRESLQWAAAVEADLIDYIDNGDDTIVLSTPEPIIEIDPITEPQPILVEPETPDLPDSAVTAFVSSIAMTFTAVVHFIF